MYKRGLATVSLALLVHSGSASGAPAGASGGTVAKPPSGAPPRLSLTEPSSLPVAALSLTPQRQPTRPYSTSQSPRLLTAAIENLVIVAFGLGYYYYDRELNSIDWEFGYNWDTLRAKLVGDGYSFDTNHFNTNYVAHPAAGLLYYTTARANHLGVAGSLAFAFGSSTLWEFIAEYRERVSLNDTFVTPFAGFAFGESLIQLSNYFARSCSNGANAWLSALFSPLSAGHDAATGAQVGQDPHCDRFGLSTSGYHRFEASWLSGVWIPLEPSTKTAIGSTELNVSFELAQLDGLGTPTTGWQTFSDGNLSSLNATVSFTDYGTNAYWVDAQAVAAGLHYQALRGEGRRSLYGSEFLLGAGAGAEYAKNQYRSSTDSRDSAFVLELPMLMALWVQHFGQSQLELGLSLSPALAGITSFALADYQRLVPDPPITNVSRAHGYNHALGVSASPRLRVVMPQLELALTGRSDALSVVRDYDGNGETRSPVPVQEFRRRLRASATIGPARGARGTLALQVLEREAVMGDDKQKVTRRFAAWGLMAGISLRY